MKKTLNINIGNSIIHIDEDAYEILTVYLNEIKHHFGKSADDFEIVTDIENRIAEMFAEVLVDQRKQSINSDDVQAMIGQMGSVKDFENIEESADDFIEASQVNPVKKLYRDPDHAMIAGVSAGLGHYLNIDPRWIRIVAFCLIFVAGSGIVTYIILWIMVPRAKTRAEKMEMRGEETNLKGFANSNLQPFVKQSRGFIAEVFDVLGNFMKSTGHVVFKVIAGIIVSFGALFLLSLIATLAAFLGLWDSEIYQYFPVNIINKEYLSALTIAFFIVLSIPVLALILFSIRVAFNDRPANKPLSFGLLIFWLAGIVTSIFYVAKISSEFKEGAQFEQSTALKSYAEYTLVVDRTRFFTKEDSLNYKIDVENYRGRKILETLDNDFKAPRNIELNIEKSATGKTSLNQSYRARGKTFEMALQNARHIHYGFLQQGALLNFSPSVSFPISDNWRGQETELTLKIPVGTHIRISKELNRFLNGRSYWDCDHERDSEFTDWIMKETGLECKHKVVEPEGQ